MSDEKDLLPKKKKKDLVGDRFMNSKSFCTLAQINTRGSFWVNKKFGKESMTGFEWCAVMIDEKLIDEVPKIFNDPQQ